MVTGHQKTYAYRGNQPKGTRELLEWHARSQAVEILEPALPILDCHHHLFGTSSDRLFYRMQDLRKDVSSGHNVIGTVYVEAYESGWRQDGLAALRPIGEIEMIVQQTAGMQNGPCKVAAGIVGHADLTLGLAVAEVLDAEKAAGLGRLCGIRYRVAWDGGTIAQVIKRQPQPHLLSDPNFRKGVACVASAGLCFETWIYHTQVSELLSLADACPDVTIVICHLATPIGIGEYAERAGATFAAWKAGIFELSERQNIRLKLGGFGMPVFGFGFDDWPMPPDAQQLANSWTPYLDTCIAAFGTQRCMFESNFPVDKQSCSYGQLWNAYKLYSSGFSVEERADLFYRTASATYRLDEMRAIGDHAMGF